jgi:hypothetical protein
VPCDKRTLFMPFQSSNVVGWLVGWLVEGKNNIIHKKASSECRFVSIVYSKFVSLAMQSASGEQV